MCIHEISAQTGAESKYQLLFQTNPSLMLTSITKTKQCISVEGPAGWLEHVASEFVQQGKIISAKTCCNIMGQLSENTGHKMT